MNQTRGRFFWIDGLCIFILRLVSGARRAKPTFVVTFVNRVAALRRLRPGCAPPQFTDALGMKWLGGAHEDVIAAVRRIQAEGCGHLLEIADDVIGLFLRSAIVEFGRALNVYAVFVGAGQKKGFDALLSLTPRDQVSDNHRVQVAQMREAVGVIDGRGDVEGGHRTFWFSSTANTVMRRPGSTRG